MDPENNEIMQQVKFCAGKDLQKRNIDCDMEKLESKIGGVEKLWRYNKVKI